MDYKYKCVTDVNELREYVTGNKVVACDFETAPDDAYRNVDKAALDPAISHIVGCSFSTEVGTGIYVPVAHKVGENINRDDFFVFLKEFLESKDITKVIHNIEFESKFAYKYGIVIQPPVYDTICASQMTLKDEYNFRGLHDSGLKTLATEVLHIKLPKFTDVTAGHHYDELDAQDKETIRYGAADSDFALRLYHLFNQWFDANLPKHRYIVENIESPAAIFMGIMKYYGVCIDKDKMIDARKKLTAEKDELYKEIISITGDIKIGESCNTKAFKTFLYETEGLPEQYQAVRNPRTGKLEMKLSVNDEAMQNLEEYCHEYRHDLEPLFPAVRHYRKLGKVISTYIDGYMKQINVNTGRIHANFMSLSTDTGRMSCDSPNIQNMPRKSNDEAGVRAFIYAPEGYYILSVDFSQIELRVGAFYCRDNKMMETYQNGGDIHATTMNVIFGDEDSTGSKHASEHRVIAKQCNFGTFYGLFPKGLYRTLKYKAHVNRTVDECAEIINNIKNGYPGLTTWQAETKYNASKNLYVETWLGRRRYLPNIRSTSFDKQSSDERRALNTPIQGTAADMMKLACGRVIEGLPEHMYLQPIIQIHDELVFYVPKEKLHEAVSFVKECMEEKPFEEFDVPLIAEAEYGENFADLKEVD